MKPEALVFADAKVSSVEQEASVILEVSVLPEAAIISHASVVPETSVFSTSIVVEVIPEASVIPVASAMPEASLIPVASALPGASVIPEASVIQAASVVEKSAVIGKDICAGESTGTFMSFLRDLPEATLLTYTKSYFRFKAVEKKWIDSNVVKKRAKKKESLARQNVGTKVRHRLATGIAFLKWEKDNGKASQRNIHVAFLQQEMEVRELPSKRQRAWLARCIGLAKAVDDEAGPHAIGVIADASKPRSLRPHSACARTPYALLRRRRGLQGPPFKCAQMRERLWQWFVMIRGSISASISPKFVLQKARAIASEMIQEMRRTSEWMPVPIIDRHWLLRGKADFGVVFRKPNRRIKLSKEVMTSRLKAMWLNVIRVRQLAIRTLGFDLRNNMWGFDQKGIYMNENGNRNTRTLEIQGAPAVWLKENHADTRARVSIMTSATSNPTRAANPATMPLEILFKGKTKTILRHVGTHDDLSLTFQYGVRGSYRTEHVVRFLQRVLPVWTVVRESEKDWGIVFLDSFRGHLGTEVEELCFSRGFVLLYHYGGTTGVAQVNDTDCHAEFESVYLEIESSNFASKQMVDASDISRSREEVVQDVAQTWRQLRHTRGVDGHKYTGLSSALCGADDELISREARIFWLEAGMHSARKAAVDDINARVDAGTIGWADVRSIVLHPSDKVGFGPVDEGHEFEDALEVGESSFQTAADVDIEALDDVDVRQMHIAAKEMIAQLVTADDSPDVIKEAESLALRLSKLKRIRAAADSCDMPQIKWYVEREAKRIRKTCHAPKGETQKRANAIQSLHMQSMQALEQEKLSIARAALAVKKKNKARVQKLRAVAKAAADVRRDKKRKLQASCSAVVY